MLTPIETAIANYFRALATMDIEGFVNAFTPDGVSHDPVGTPPLEGHDALRAFLTAINGGLESGGLTVDQAFPCGNSAAVKWTGKGVGKNGKPVAFEGIDVLHCNDEGKITLLHAYWDPGPVMAILQS
jgi:steroid delta-isomerase